MPRITSYPNDEQSVSTDLCRYCYLDQIEDKHYMLAQYGPGYDTDVEHPDYSSDDYRCERCSTRLRDRDA